MVYKNNIIEQENRHHNTRSRNNNRQNRNRNDRHNNNRNNRIDDNNFGFFLTQIIMIPIQFENEQLGASDDEINTLNTKIVEKNDKFDDCSICLCGYEVGQEYRTLLCGHTYHKECIDHWLKCNAICPQDREKVFH